LPRGGGAALGWRTRPLPSTLRKPSSERPKPGERVPFLFSVKQLVAKGPADAFGGDFLVPSYRGSTFLDPKARFRVPLRVCACVRVFMVCVCVCVCVCVRARALVCAPCASLACAPCVARARQEGRRGVRLALPGCPFAPPFAPPFRTPSTLPPSHPSAPPPSHDPRAQGRGASQGYESAIALQTAQDDEKVLKENIKSVSASKGERVVCFPRVACVACVPFLLGVMRGARGEHQEERLGVQGCAASWIRPRVCVCVCVCLSVCLSACVCARVFVRARTLRGA
jgi:hypothetical protein